MTGICPGGTRVGDDCVNDGLVQQAREGVAERGSDVVTHLSTGQS